jgi:outer membrane protein OmpA-like peptidoglycan-associated protein
VARSASRGGLVRVTAPSRERGAVARARGGLVRVAAPIRGRSVGARASGGASAGGAHALVALAALGAWLAPGVAAAQDRRFNVELFAPAADSRGLVTVDRADPLGHLDVSFGLWVAYARNPLVLVPAGSGGGSGDRFPVVRNMATGDLHAALGLFGRAELSLLVPVTILEGAPGGEAMGFGPRVGVHALGDPSVKVKAAILDRRRHGVGLAVLAGVRFPGGGAGPERDFLTSGGAELFPRLIADTRLGPVALAANVGVNLRLSRAAGECCAGAAGAFRVGHELTLGLGAALAVVPDRLDVVLEANARAGLTGEGDFWARAPVEVLAAAKAYVARNSFLVLGASYGVTRLAGPAYGAPEPRAFVGITYEPHRGDRDGDGYDDGADRCPDEAEDFDAFEDPDGCPEPDNDVDTVLDGDDACPNDPGPPENRGCPLEAARGDRDGDSLYDDVDACPDEAEDFDGFDDGDGCPDPDNDIDGILDKDDACPNEAEDMDGDRDDDGCPEPPRVKRVGSRFITLEKIHFEHDKAVISKESWGLLFDLARALNDDPLVGLLRVEGHTDSDGSAEYNLRLSAARARAVRDFLVTRGGVSAARLVSEGYGEGRPVAGNDTDEGKAANRRVEFVILKEDGARPK